MFKFTRLAVGILSVAFLVAPLCTTNAQTAARPGSTGRATTTSNTRSTSRTSTAGRTGSSASNRNSSANLYPRNTDLGEATITIDPETRSLVIVTDEDTHKELEKVIRKLDQIKPQVLIKVVFVEVTYNKGYDVGLEGSYTFNVSSPNAAISGNQTATTTKTSGNTSTVTTVTKDLSTAATTAGTVAVGDVLGLSSVTQGSFVRVASDDWQATLNLLSTKGKLEVLSRPSIMARNNQEAVIVVGQEVPFVTNSRITESGETINTIQYDNVGIILRVTPFITSEGTVEMIVAPEISTLTDQKVAISNNASAPVIAKRSAETVVVTPNAKTVVIGGLMENQNTESIRKIPLLGDIPVVGTAFRHTVKDTTKRELLIFLTPYIVNTEAGVQQVSDRELDNAELVHKSFSEDELNKFLDSQPIPPKTIPDGK